jgi:hypothetical protein
MKKNNSYDRNAARTLEARQGFHVRVVALRSLDRFGRIVSWYE